MKYIIKLFLFIFLYGTYFYATADTLRGDQFYGEWSTSSSKLNPKRQILKLSNSGGVWIQIDERGEEKKLNLSKENISIENDLLTVNYKDIAQGYALKLVLGGWTVGNKKSIFGTVFMYNQRENGFQLFNGIPVSFQSGVRHIPPQVIWSFFESNKVKFTSSSAIKSLEESIAKIDGVEVAEEENTTVYSLKSLKTVIVIVKFGHAAFPSAVGFQYPQQETGIIKIAAWYAGDKKEFEKYFSEFEEELNQAKKESEKYIDALVKKIEAQKSTNQSTNNKKQNLYY